ncbi:MAG TPA: phBC6A51 family helix-turn-helix protein, partial [Chloroflexota bacterium]|nr:phBC6A51 family helix-turn-helix protein [Chloroflexota bacterium]
ITLADGKTQRAVANELDINDKTLYRWLQTPEFSAEVDRLTLMMGIAARAERLRIVKRVVSQRVRDDMEIESDRDLLDWLKYVQGETDGVKLDLAALAETAISVAGEGSHCATPHLQRREHREARAGRPERV